MEMAAVSAAIGGAALGCAAAPQTAAIPADYCNHPQVLIGAKRPYALVATIFGRPVLMAPFLSGNSVLSWVYHVDVAGSVWCCGAVASSAEDRQPSTTPLLSERKTIVEERWREFFADPSQWWDHRSEKLNAGYPDFKHKKKTEALWLKDKLRPPWVEAELATLAPGAVKLSTFSQNLKLQRLVKSRKYEKALELFHQMQRDGNRPDKFTFTRALNACAGLRCLEEGRLIHAQITRSGCESDVFVGSSLVDMYAKCGSIEDGRAVFDNMSARNVVCWNAMIRGYVRCGEGKKALKLFRKMKRDGVEPNCVTFLGLINACASLEALKEGRVLHAQIIKSGFESDEFVSSSLVDMYSKCGNIEDAWRVFSNMPKRDVVSWNTMLLGYKNCGQGEKAMELYQQMQLQGIEPDSVTYVGVLNACTSIGALEKGRSIHTQVIESGLQSNLYICNSLLDMYSKCGSVEDAWRVFNNMPSRDVVSWNAMIMGYVKCGQGHRALELFLQMHNDGVLPDRVTFTGALNACGSAGALSEGRNIHAQVIKSGCESDVFVACSLIHMYATCGRMDEACKVFNDMPERTVVSWNAMIMGYVKCGQGQKALELSREMQWDGVEPDHITLLGVINACVSVSAHADGKGLGNACRIFESLPTRNLLSWNALILGHVRCGQLQQVLELSRRMQREGVDPDRVTIYWLLNACATMGALQEGRVIHKQIMERGFESDVLLGGCLVNMYAKCGSIEDAWKVFNKMPTHDAATWNALIHGHMECGKEQEAIDVSQKMELGCNEQDPISVMGLLNICCNVQELGLNNSGPSQSLPREFESDVLVGKSLLPNMGA